MSGYRVTRQQSEKGGLHTFHAGALDPATGGWAALPWSPPTRDDMLYGQITGWGPVVFSTGYLYDDATGRSTAVSAPAHLSDGAVALSSDRLMVFGGYRTSGPPGVFPTEVTPSNDAWSLRVG